MPTKTMNNRKERKERKEGKAFFFVIFVFSAVKKLHL
jgi:hypothetical protein